MEYNLPEYLPQWNKEDEEFNKLIFNKGPIQPPEIRNINDLDLGAIGSALYWHFHVQERAVNETLLQNARDVFLRLWEKFLNFSKPYPMSDEEYSGYIIQSILSGSISITTIKNIFSGFQVKTAPELPAFSDWAFSDLGALEPTHPYYICQAITYARSCVVYVFMDDLSNYTPLMQGKIKAGYPAGIGLYIVVY